MTGRDRGSRERRGVVPVVLPCLRIVPSVENQAEVAVSYRDDHTSSEVTATAEFNDVGALISRYVERAGTPVRVEIQAADGSVYADIVHPSGDSPGSGGIDDPLDGGGESGSVVEQGGFLPGELIVVALVVARRHADPRGRVVCDLDREVLPGSGEALLLGTISATAVTKPLL